jgi:hypothetical protein
MTFVKDLFFELVDVEVSVIFDVLGVFVLVGLLKVFVVNVLDSLFSSSHQNVHVLDIGFGESVQVLFRNRR